MLHEPFKFLSRLRKLQRTEEGSLFIDRGNKKICLVDCSDTSVASYDLSKKWHKVYSMLRYLEKLGCVEWDSSFYFHLTYDGFHYVEKVRDDFRRLLVRSFLLPVAVSLATTLITLWITGAFTAR